MIDERIRRAMIIHIDGMCSIILLDNETCLFL
jgi:hypothetical protein